MNFGIVLFIYVKKCHWNFDGDCIKSCLENPMDGGAWWAALHGVARSRTRLSNFTFTFHFHTLEKEMATHSSVLAGRIPGTGEPGGLPSMGSHRVGHNWSNLAAAAAALNLYMALGSMDILTILSVLIHKHGISFPVFVSSLISFISDYSFWL